MLDLAEIASLPPFTKSLNVPMALMTKYNLFQFQGAQNLLVAANSSFSFMNALVLKALVLWLWIYSSGDWRRPVLQLIHRALCPPEDLSLLGEGPCSGPLLISASSVPVT